MPPRKVKTGKMSPSKHRRSAESDDDAPKKKRAIAVKVEQSDQADDEPSKMVTVLKRGAVPVDHCSSYIATHQVYYDKYDVWDAMLNQTDVSGGQNKNKYYVIQILHPVSDNSQCVLYTRWGRVGENGSSMTKGPWPAAVAVQQFKKQFKAKTATAWENRHGMVAQRGKYTWLERDFEATEEEESGCGDVKKEEKKETPAPESQLSMELLALCNIIFSTSVMDAALSSMNYDARKLPLGKLAKATILNGFSALKKLADVLDNPSGPQTLELGGLQAACESLSSAYYSIIPHDFGRRRPIIINDMSLLKRELELVDALGDMEVAQKLIAASISTDASGNVVNPVDARFLSLGLSSMEPVNQDSKEFTTLQAYARDTHGATHAYQAHIQHAFRVERAQETQAWKAAGFEKLGKGNRLLLWHGSRSSNFAGILKQGLRIAPPEAPVTGYMFGKGVYFADMMTKAANYCHSYLSSGIGILLLCEVAAKPFHEEMHANYMADEHCKMNKKMCTKGIGRTQPVKWQDAGAALDYSDLVGCHMPLGPAGDQSIPTSLQYNEYIAYDPSQIRVRYLLTVMMNSR